MLDNPYTRHHKRFILAAIVAFGAYWPLGVLPGMLRLILSVDIFFAVYLVLMLHLVLANEPDDLRERARTEDEGILVIALLTVGAIGFSLFSIFSLLNKGDGPDQAGLFLALGSIPLGWLTLHTMAAQHYTNLFYARRTDEDGKTVDRGGLDFPGDEDPNSWDFLYFSFVVGMTAQTSDVDISAADLRRAVLAHSVASFFYNTVLVAVAVNAAVGGSH